MCNFKEVAKQIRSMNKSITKVRAIYVHKKFPEFIRVELLDHGNEFYEYYRLVNEIPIPISEEYFMQHTKGTQKLIGAEALLKWNIFWFKEFDMIPKSEW